MAESPKVHNANTTTLAVAGLLIDSGYADGEYLSIEPQTEDTTDKIESVANGFTDFNTGDLIFITGAGAGSNAGKWVGPIVKVDDGELTIPDGQIGDQASGGSVTIRTRRLIDGTTAKSYSVEYQLTASGAPSPSLPRTSLPRIGPHCVSRTSSFTSGALWTLMICVLCAMGFQPSTVR